MTKTKAKPEQWTPPKPWPEATVLSPANREKNSGEPVVLVRRNKVEDEVVTVGARDTLRMHLFRGTLTAITLFTGAGGMDLGLEMAGVTTLCQHEWDWCCCETLIANRPKCFRRSALIQGDIRKTPTSMLLGEAGLRVGECDIIAGGPPCQGFSTAGKRNPSDLRNTLVYEFLRVVNEARPRHFIMENVPGFISLADGRFLSSFLRQAFDSYYEIVYGLVNASDYGVPQDRTRFLAMGTRRDRFELDGILGGMPAPENYSHGDLRKLKSKTFPEEEKALIRHAPGIRYFPDRPVLVPPRPNCGGPDNGRSKGYIEFYRKLRKEEPDRIVNVPRVRRRAVA